MSDPVANAPSQTESPPAQPRDAVAAAPARPRRASQAPARAVLPAAAGDAAPALAASPRCWRSTSPACFAAIFTALCVKAVLLDGDWSLAGVAATRREDTSPSPTSSTVAAVRALGPLRRPRAAARACTRIVASLFQVTVVALIFALVNGETFSSYYIFYGTLFFAIVYVGSVALGSTSRSPGCCCARRATAAARCSSARASTSRRSPTRSPSDGHTPRRDASASSR